MKTIEAETVVIDDCHYLQINTDPAIKIPISSENANDVKSAFCSLIGQLRKGVFQLKLKESEKDLFYYVASEYLNQLNREMQDVYGEMENDGLLLVDEDKI